MANISAGTAYVDVKLGSVEKFKKNLKDSVEEAGRESGRSGGESFTEEFNQTVKKKTTTKVKETFEQVGKSSGKTSGESAADNFQKSFAERVGKAAAVLRGNLLAFLAPVLVSMGPFLGGVLGGAIIAALPIAAIAGGIALVAKDPRISEAGKKIGEKLLSTLRQDAQVLIQPLLSVFDLFSKRMPELTKPIQGMFLTVSQFIIPLANSLINMLKPILEGINTAIGKSRPIFDVFLRGLERIGVVLGDFFKKISSDPEAIEGMTDALDDLFGILVLVIKWFGNFIVSASRAYAQFKDAWGAIKSWFTGTIVPSLTRAWNQLKGVFDTIGDFFQWWWDRFRDKSVIGSNSVKNAINTMKASVSATLNALVATVTQIPNKIVNSLTSLGSRLYTVGVNAIRGLLNGFASLIPTLLGKAQALANNIAGTIAGALKVGSPSKVMEEIGMWTGKGFEIGLDSSMSSINLPAPIQQITGNYGSISEPQMDSTGSAAISIGTYVANENLDPWRQAEDWWFMVSARGTGV